MSVKNISFTVHYCLFQMNRILFYPWDNLLRHAVPPDVVTIAVAKLRYPYRSSSFHIKRPVRKNFLEQPDP